MLPVFLLIGLIVAGFFLIKDEQSALSSPVPKFVAAVKAASISNWFPKTEAYVSQKITPLQVSAKSALVVDYNSGEVVFEKDPTTRLPVASTVKIMTALVVLENSDLNKVFTVSAKAAKVGENSMGLTLGEKLTVRELLYGLMLVSGNDAAVTLAEGVAGSEDQFEALMNGKAQELGLKNTRFVNASGLDDDGKLQYSTAADLTAISHYVWQNYPEFRKISSTVHEYIGANQNHKEFDLYNDTNLLTTYPGVQGIKPGFTWEAGLCLVSYAENNGKQLLAVVLGSDDRRGEMKELLDYGFSTFGIKISHPALD